MPVTPFLAFIVLFWLFKGTHIDLKDTGIS